MNPVTRRAFLAQSTLAALAVPLGRAWPQASAPQIAFPGDARSRIAVSSYPFRDFIQGQHDSPAEAAKKPLVLKDFPAHVAEKFGIRRIEPWSEHFLSTAPAYLDEFHNAAAKAGVSIINFAADHEDSFYAPDAATRARAVAFGKQWLDIAARLGSPSVRISQPPSGHAKPNLALVRESLHPLADYAASRNVVIHLENDNPLSEDPFFVASLVDRLSSPWIRALPDFGNSLAALPSDDAYRGLDEMFVRAYAISHVKPGTANAAGQPVTVDLKRSFAIAKKHAFQGFFSMEYESSGDPYEGTKQLIAATLANLA